MSRLVFCVSIIGALWFWLGAKVFSGGGSEYLSDFPMYESPMATAGSYSSAGRMKTPSIEKPVVPMSSSSPFLRHTASAVNTCSAPQYSAPSSSSSSSYRVYTSSSQVSYGISGGGVPNGGGYQTHSAPASSAPIAMASVPSVSVPSLPLAARSMEGGITSDKSLRLFNGPRGIIIDDDDDYGDDDLRPEDPKDPFHTPVGDIPWVFMFGLCVLYVTVVRRKRHQSLN